MKHHSTDNQSQDKTSPTMITRRESLVALAGLPLAVKPNAVSAAHQRTTGMGLVIYDRSHFRQLAKRKDPRSDLFSPSTFLKHCLELGAGGMQARLGVMESDSIKALRSYAEQHQLYIEAIISPPKDKTDVGRFKKEIKTAKDVDAKAVRTVILPGRRYERFKTREEFLEYEQRGIRMIELAAPVVERFQIPLAIENHKDQRDEDRLALFKHIDSEFVGACVDTGNSVALLHDPIETVRNFAPWAKSVHLKDQALQLYSDGFLLGDIPLGMGAFDLPKMVAILRRAQPNIRFSLELLTRDALRVPCLSPGYFATMPEIPAKELAAMLKYVRDHQAKSLQEVSKLSLAQRAELETNNVRKSIEYARNVLKL